MINKKLIVVCERFSQAKEEMRRQGISDRGDQSWVWVGDYRSAMGFYELPYIFIGYSNSKLQQVICQLKGSRCHEISIGDIPKAIDIIVQDPSIPFNFGIVVHPIARSKNTGEVKAWARLSFPERNSLEPKAAQEFAAELIVAGLKAAVLNKARNTDEKLPKEND